MKLEVFLALLVALNTFLNPFISAIGLRTARNPRSERAKSSLVTSPSAAINGQTAGPTPFIVQVNATVTPANSLKSFQFSVTPKSGSVTRPVSAIYSSSYLQNHGYLNTGTGAVVVPVFGLYANFSNTAVLTFFFTDGSSQQSSVPIQTPDWTDSCDDTFKNPTLIQARTASTSLSYDYILLKNLCGGQSPIIIDTDGVVRWVGPTGYGTQSSMFFANGIYIASTPPLGSNRNGISRIELDGVITFVHDYSNVGVTSSHHNYDPGKRGMLLEVNTSTQTESVILEVDTSGNVLETWNFADIISQAMTAGGDDPTQFVKSAPTDWFHMNAATYRKSDNTLIVSSRENFVIAVDYDTQQIKWILGDPTKKWHQFPSLQQYALSLDPNSLPPIGEHALSITYDDNLLLFDNGLSSMFQSPPGADRSYSGPRKYHLDTQAMTATEVWNYPNGQSLYSRICSSIYEDDPTDYVVDYADITNLGPAEYAEILGLDNANNKVFDYRYITHSCLTMWNAIPIHLERMMFTSVVPLSAVSRKTHASAGTYDINLPLSGTPGIECRGDGGAGNYQVVITFPQPIGINTATVTPGNGGTGSVSGAPSVSGNQVTVDLTGVSNAQTLTVNLLGVTDGVNTDDISVTMSILTGDTNRDGFVDSADISQTKAQSGNPVGAGNFREDLNADGFLDSADIAFVKSKSGTTLP